MSHRNTAAAPVARWCLVLVALLTAAGTGRAQATTAAPAGEQSPATPASAAGGASTRATAPLDRRVSLDFDHVRLEVVLDAIDRQAHVGLQYTPRAVPVNRRVSIHVKGATVQEALEAVLRGTGVTVEGTATGEVMLVKDEGAHGAADADTTGHAAVVVRVTDTTTARPIPGAVIGVQGMRLVTTTNEQGYALLRSVPSGLRVVTVRFLGYAPAERQIVVPDSAYTRVDFALHMGMTRLQDVVTTATGQRRRYELGNDITILDVDSIVATQPVSSVTQLLEGRVPGLEVQHTSGAPGDPSRLRLRGTSSVLRGNDPIVIVDGIRVYAAQSDSTSANLASNLHGGWNGAVVAAPSPLDQLDPNSIATIEVMKGPSAATLYGPDAANGVIVITTKKGREGPTTWTASASRGTSYMPGQYPMGIYRFGHDGFGTPELCPLTQFDCTADSVVRFQALNEDKYTVLGHGQNTSVSLGVSGGTAALTYALTGSYDDETGILELPGVEAERFATLHGGAAPPHWMGRPQQLTRWSGTSRLTAKLGDKADASLSTTLTREKQQRSTLEQQISTLMGTYIDAATGTYWRTNGNLLSKVDELIPDFYRRATDDATNFTNAANVTWRPLSWLTTSADGGINVISRADEVLLPRGMLISDPTDSSGILNAGHGGTVVSTVNLRATAAAPLPLGFRLQLATGANYTKSSVSAFATGVSDLAPGTSSFNGAGKIDFAAQSATDVASFGWYIEPSFTHRRFTISTGLRLDGSSTFGTHVKLPAFPKLGVSWLISEEPFFPLKNLFDVFRVRAAYGRAGVWPGPADQLRLYTTTRPWWDGGFEDALDVSKIGNSQLKPERSSEMEGGFDADMLGDRLSIEFSGYRKMRYDAIMSVPVAPSVYGNGVQMLRNIGVIRNTGLELSVTMQLLRTDPVTWNTTFNLSRNHNMVTELGAGVTPFGPNDARVVAGYPLFGRWARPILGYADADSNRVITRNEVLLGDTLVYMGSSEPKYEANLFTTFSFLRGALTATAGFAYQDGLTQVNNAIGGPGQPIFSPGMSDPSSSFGEQAAVAVMNETSYGLLQTVNTLRLNSISVAFNAPPTLARRFGTKALSIAIQGTNVGLWTNYKGKDPNVNAFSTGNSVVDTGVLPIPRSWLLSVHATY
ncbi:MAG TPA: TonB-dependent receptor plug domain-containing protein [Gemmatimonadaceae bacterium]